MSMDCLSIYFSLLQFLQQCVADFNLQFISFLRLFLGILLFCMLLEMEFLNFLLDYSVLLYRNTSDFFQYCSHVLKLNSYTRVIMCVCAHAHTWLFSSILLRIFIALLIIFIYSFSLWCLFCCCCCLLFHF